MNLLIILIIMCLCIPCFILIPGVNSIYCCALCFVLILNLIYGFKKEEKYTCANVPQGSEHFSIPYSCKVGKLKDGHDQIGCPDEGCTDALCCDDSCNKASITWNRLYKEKKDKDGNDFSFSTRMTETTYNQRKENCDTLKKIKECGL